MDVVIDSVRYIRGRGLVVVVSGGDEWPTKGPAFFRDTAGERTCTVVAVEGFNSSTTYGLVIRGAEEADFVIGGTISVRGSGHRVDAITWERVPID